MAQERKIGNSDKSPSAVDWYAKEHLKLLVQLENKELTLGEYVVKHQDILQKAKSIEDLTSLKKRNTELQDQVLLNDTTKKPMSKNNMTAVEWYYEQTVVLGMTNYAELLEQAKQMEKEQIVKANRDGVDMVIDNKSFLSGQEYYNETYGKE